MVAQRVALMGPGKMGAPMGLNLIKAGHQLSVWARRPESAAALVQAGASFKCPRTGGNDVIIDMLQVSQLEPARRPGRTARGVSAPTVLVVSSTVAPGRPRAGQRVGPATGGLLRVVDAPVSGGGGRPVAPVMVGGDDDAVAGRPVLRRAGPRCTAARWGRRW